MILIAMLLYQRVYMCGRQVFNWIVTWWEEAVHGWYKTINILVVYHCFFNVKLFVSHLQIGVVQLMILGISINGGTPKSSILMEFSQYKVPP